MKKILFSLFLFLISIPAWATVYYVDYTNGSDSNNGTSLVTAFKTMAPTTGTNFLLPGDHVEIVPGNTFVGSDCGFNVNSSGTLSNPIVIERYQAISGTDPIFDCASSAASISGWTGWSISFATYTFTVTSANATVGAVYSNSGNNFTVSTTISGATTLVTAGVLAPASSGTLTLVSGTGDSTITFSSNVVSNVVYKSNIVVPWTVTGVIVDGAYLLIGVGAANSGMLTNTTTRYYQTGGFMFVRLSDNTDPNGHSIEFTGLYNNVAFKGTITTNGNYIYFNHLQVYGSPQIGFLIANRGIHVDNSSSIFSGRESLYCATFSQTVGCYNSVFNRFTGQYSNGSDQDGGNGQNLTIEGSYNDLINSTIQLGTMAGVDILGYQPSTNPPNMQTPASYNRVINNLIQMNSQRSLSQHDAGGFDPQVYCDGGNNNQFINNTIIGTAAEPSTGGIKNFIDGIRISSEHPTTNIDHDNYIYNNLIYNNNSSQIGAISVTSGSLNIGYNLWIIGNTVYGLAYSGIGGGVSVNHINPAFGKSVHIYNNIFYNVGGGGTTTVFGTNSPTLIDSNYNIFDTTNSSFVFFVSSTSTNYSFSGWQSLTGGDTNSLYTDPKFVTNGSDFHLQRTALGQSNTSPAIGIALPGYSNSWFNNYNLGSTATNNIVDSSLAPDLGYHYNYVFGSSNDWHKGFTESYN